MVFNKKIKALLLLIPVFLHATQEVETQASKITETDRFIMVEGRRIAIPTNRTDIPTVLLSTLQKDDSKFANEQGEKHQIGNSLPAIGLLTIACILASNNTNNPPAEPQNISYLPPELASFNPRYQVQFYLPGASMSEGYLILPKKLLPHDMVTIHEIAKKLERNNFFKYPERIPIELQNYLKQQYLCYGIKEYDDILLKLPNFREYIYKAFTEQNIENAPGYKKDNCRFYDGPLGRICFYHGPVRALLNQANELNQVATYISQARWNDNKIELQQYAQQLAVEAQKLQTSWQHFHFNHDRISAINELLLDGPTTFKKEHTLSDNLKKLLSSKEAQDFGIAKGNVVQLLLHQELLNNMERVSQLHLKHPANPQITELTNSVIKLSSSSLKNSQKGYLVHAFEISAICKNAIDVSEAIVDGIIQGASNFSHALAHPLQTLQDAAQGIGNLILINMKLAIQAEQISDLSSKHPEMAQEIRNELVATLNTVDTCIKDVGDKLASLSFTDAVRETTALGTDFVLGARIIGWAKGAKNILKRVSPLISTVVKENQLLNNIKTYSANIKMAQAGCLHIARDKALLASPAAQRINQAIRLSGFEEKLSMLKKRFDGILVGLKEHGLLEGKKMEIPYRHVLHTEIEPKLKSYGIKEIFTGFHHDHLGFWEKNGVIDIRNKKMGPYGTYAADIFFQGEKYAKTFFPQEWDEVKVIEKIIEAFNNSVVKEFNGITYKLEGITTEGIKIFMAIDKEGVVKTIYPIVEKFI
jgi:hypothetical protein